MSQKIDFPKIGDERAPLSQKKFSISDGKDQNAILGNVKVTIDGNEISVPYGTTILEAAKKLNIYILNL